MARIVVIGAGLNGVSVAMLLGADGHQVTVLERDRFEPPADPETAWADWQRRGVAQFRLPHFMLPRWRVIVERELPEVAAELDRWGASRVNVLADLPAELTDGVRPGEDDRGTLTARRPIVEGALANVAARSVDIRRGVGVVELCTARGVTGSVPHVTGVRTDTGERIGADLVVDAAGRRSQLPNWLSAIGARPPLEHSDESGFVYCARHFRSRDGGRPVFLAGPIQDYASVSLLTLPADNDTWSVAFIAASNDRALRPLRRPDRWSAALSRYPLAAHWARRCSSPNSTILTCCVPSSTSPACSPRPMRHSPGPASSTVWSNLAPTPRPAHSQASREPNSSQPSTRPAETRSTAVGKD
jgi:2-polyprenyl-6-methoxyphenol hydroxylase-like FAD-dependent oxidoreductase